jgi:hypothetical protein
MMNKTVVGRLQAVPLNHFIEKPYGVAEPIFERAPTPSGHVRWPESWLRHLEQASNLIGNLHLDYQAIEERAVML